VSIQCAIFRVHCKTYFYVTSQRLNSILAKRSLGATKLDEIKIKANILKAFVEEKIAEEKEKIAREESEL